jgi:hypothetical protein
MDTEEKAGTEVMKERFQNNTGDGINRPWSSFYWKKKHVDITSADKSMDRPSATPHAHSYHIDFIMTQTDVISILSFALHTMLLKSALITGLLVC